MFASILRRAFNDRLQFQGWKEFGGLLVRQHNPGKRLIQLGAGGEKRFIEGHAEKVCNILNDRAKAMLT